MKIKNKLAAFTLVEMLMAIALVGILSAVSVGLYDSSLDEARFDATYKEMLQIRKAILGDLENTTIEGERIRFGYIGDMGIIPTASQGLSALNTQLSNMAGWSINATGKIGVGWNGPYLVSSTDVDYTKDAWNRNYIYNGTASVPYILSYGADGVLGGTGVNQDIQVDIPISLRSATVNGQIVTSGSVYQGSAYVEIYYPASSGGSYGVMSSTAISLVGTNQGTFSFNNIPFGLRTVRVQIPSSANPQLTLGPVTFAVDNQNYVIPSNVLEINPLASDSNCNTIQNIAYIAGSIDVDTTNKKIGFKLKIDKSFSTKAIYTTNTGGGASNSLPLEQIGIGGVVYGCTGVLDWLFFGGALNSARAFAQCNTGSGNVNLNATPNLTLNSAWGIASGDEVQAFETFTNAPPSTTTISLKVGCDTITIQ